MLCYLHLAYGWTQAHGFFAIMGGFMIEREVLDKGRGDAFSKGLTLIQTTWFILQCIARKYEDLPITELELVTLAFATLNFMTCAEKVHQCEEVGIGAGGSKGTGEDEDNIKEVWSMIAEDIDAALFKLTVPDKHPTRKTLEIVQAYISLYRWHILFLLSPVFVPLLVLAHTLSKYGESKWGKGGVVIEEGAKGVPTFYNGKLTANEGDFAFYAMIVIAGIFGGIHCVAWSFEFPSHVEQLLWRITSIIITSVVPLSMVRRVIWNVLPAWVRKSFLVVCIAVYIVGRLISMVLAFMALRSLSSEAYQIVQWTAYIPHV